MLALASAPFDRDFASSMATLADHFFDDGYETEELSQATILELVDLLASLPVGDVIKNLMAILARQLMSFEPDNPRASLAEMIDWLVGLVLVDMLEAPDEVALGTELLRAVLNDGIFSPEGAALVLGKPRTDWIQLALTASRLVVGLSTVAACQNSELEAAGNPLRRELGLALA